MDKKEIAEKIKEFREKAQVSQMQLEVSIGAAAGSISRIENGRVNPTKETLYKIAEKLKLQQEEIIALFGIGKLFE